MKIALLPLHLADAPNRSFRSLRAIASTPYATERPTDNSRIYIDHPTSCLLPLLTVLTQGQYVLKCVVLSSWLENENASWECV